MTKAGPTRTLTDSDLQRFHELAPQLLQHRTAGYFLRELDSSINFFLAGAIPIVGVAFLGWSAVHWLVMLVVGCWVGFGCDCVRLRFLKHEIRAYCEHVVDDNFVSVVGEALRRDKKEVPEAHIARVPNYLSGVFIDVVMGTISSVIILGSLKNELTVELFSQSWFLPALIGLSAYRIGMTAWEIVDHKTHPQCFPIVKLALGLRGAAMFIVMFIVLFVTESDEIATDESARNVVYGVNGLLILIGLLNLVGMFFMISETRWLTGYLKSRNGNEIPKPFDP